ncbi:MAG: aminopeptidase P family protein [Acidobacteriia bacterium]|nr:aminopeptidase P family protein [Terriglobia bacterium]
MRNKTILFLALCISPVVALAKGEPLPKLLPWSQQVALRESWLEKRHAMILPLMREYGINMWIVANEEFHDDPLTQYVAPPRPYAGNRDFFVFIDAGDKGLRKVAVTGYSEETLKRFFESPDDPKPPAEALHALYDEYKPAKIALSFGANRGVERSLTYDTYKFISESMGPGAADHFIPAKDLIEDYLDTRIPEEFDTYTTMVRLTEILTRRALSNELIHPGKTTVGDIRRWLYDQLSLNDVGTWFQPDIRVQRKGGQNATSRGFLAVAAENVVIERGDVLHIDFGITYMGLNTDWQKMGYVLRAGEKDAPAGLKAAMKNTNLLQDAVTSLARPGKTGGEVYDGALAEMQKQGIEAKIYSHPIGNQGHGLGASIDYRSSQRKDMAASQTKPLRPGCYTSIELNTATAVPEWDNQKVYIMMEDDAYLTDQGYKFFRPRQEAFYLVK